MARVDVRIARDLGMITGLGVGGFSEVSVADVYASKFATVPTLDIDESQSRSGRRQTPVPARALIDLTGPQQACFGPVARY